MVGQNILGREFKFFPPGNLGIAIFCQTKQEYDFNLKHFTFNRRGGGWTEGRVVKVIFFTYIIIHKVIMIMLAISSWSSHNDQELQSSERCMKSKVWGKKTIFWSCCGSSAKFCVWVICKDNFKRFILSQDEDTFSVQSFYNMILQTYWWWGTHCI